MHVFFLIDALDENSGGAERFAAGLATELRRNGFEVTFCASRRIGEQYRSLFETAGVHAVSLDRRAKWDFYRLWRLRRILRKTKADVLHTHLFGSNVWGAVLGRIAGTPVIVAHDHSWAYSGQPLRRILDGQLVGRLADVFVAVCARDARQMVAFEGVPEGKVRVLPIASPAIGAIPPARNVRSELGVPADAKIVSVAARLNPEKALDVLLRAIAIVVEQQPETHLLVIGDGPCRAALEQLAGDLAIAHRVHFLGYRTDILGLLAESDCAALSSDREGMPLFVVESLAAGTPVVATDVGSVSDMVRDDETGFVVPTRSPESMAAAILRILDEPSARERMGAACRSKAANYTMSAVTRQFANLYESLAE